MSDAWEQMGCRLGSGAASSKGGCDLQALFEEAIDLSQQQGSGAGRCWYPYSYKVGYSTRRAQFILKDAIGVLGRPCSSA